MSIQTKAYDFLRDRIHQAKAEGYEVLRGRIWNQYRYELLRILAEKEGYKLILIKKEENDTHIFEVNL